MSWSLRFAEPIVLPNGAKLATLRQAIAHLVKSIPAAERGLPVVLTAAEMLTKAAEHGGPVEFARIGTLQALNRHVVRAFSHGLAPAWRSRHPRREIVARAYVLSNDA